MSDSMKFKLFVSAIASIIAGTAFSQSLGSADALERDQAVIIAHDMMSVPGSKWDEGVLSIYDDNLIDWHNTDLLWQAYLVGPDRLEQTEPLVKEIIGNTHDN